ncbi:MAG: hypothetical protein AAF571_06840 [Verrucomicrobiota bacterium]
MSPEIKIVGVMLLKNEEWTAGAALEAILGFCDEIYVFVNQSEDTTESVVREIAKREKHVHVRCIQNGRESHEPLEVLAGRPYWVFAVDGDEIYSREELAELRGRLLSGQYSEYFKLTASCLHVKDFDRSQGTAEGYLTPQAKAVTKLYNFNAITEWSGVPHQRLHGGVLKFKDGYHDDSRYHFGQEYEWEDSPFHCLHLCFMRRTSVVTQEQARKGLWNISDRESEKHQKSWWKRWWPVSSRPTSPSKFDNYCVGESCWVPLQSLNVPLRIVP